MAIIAIISIGVYNAYLLIIRQTKDGEVRQTAALEGKKIIEEIDPNIANNNFSVINNTLKIGDMSFIKSNDGYNRYLDESYNDVDKSLSKYTETITLNKTEAEINGNTVYVNSVGGEGDIGSPNNIGTFDYKIFIKKERDNIVIYSGGENEDNSNIEDIGLGTAQIEFNEDIKFSVNASWDSSTKEKKIIIEDGSGTELLGRIFKNIDDQDGKKQMKLIINFNMEDSSKAQLKNIQINLYNDDSEYLNIGLERSDNMNIDVETRKGRINFYKDKSENEIKIGDLHDIKVEIGYTDGENIFTGYYNENINID